MIKSKMSGVGTSIFAIMSQLANENGALNLSQGFPDFNPSEELMDLVSCKIKEGFNQYAPMPGILPLREKISLKTELFYKRKYDPVSEITITSGATEALYVAITTIVNSGDEVIIFEPAYDLYIPAVKASGGVPVIITLNQPDFTYNWNLVKSNITSKTKLIIINSPNNPTGTILSKSDIINLEEITRDTNILIISDEVYEHIVFDNNEHVSISTSEELTKKSFIISSFGKSYHTTGWKIGYCLAPANMMEEFRKLHQFVVFAVNTPVQYAYSEFMEDNEHFRTLPLFYQKKRDLFLKLIQKSSFKFSPSRSTYFQLLDYSEISQLDDMSFCRWLVKEAKVAAIPLSPFTTKKQEQKLIRLCFAKKNEILEEASSRLLSI